MKERGAQVAEMERDLVLEMPDIAGAPFALHGFIDRADRIGNAFAVYDYKSGRADSFGMSEGKEVAHGLSLAWLIYPLLAQEAFKSAETPPFSFLFVRDNEAKAVACAPEQEILLASMRASVAAIRTQVFPRAPHTKVVADCGECEMYRVCRRDIFTEEVPNAVQDAFPDAPPCTLAKEERE
jgi:hypothetical protein